MNDYKLHIGKMIENRLEEVGMSKAEFGRRINTSRQNINTLLRRESLDIGLLARIGKVLEYDFLKAVSMMLATPESDPLKDNQLFMLVPVTQEDRERLLKRLEVEGNRK